MWDGKIAKVGEIFLYSESGTNKEDFIVVYLVVY